MSREPVRARYSSGEASTLSGASYRQLDYWERSGMLGPRRSGGSGLRRAFIFPEIVLMRAYVLAAEVAQANWSSRDCMTAIWRPLVEAYDADDQLDGMRLIVEPDGVCVARSTTAAAALIINLAVCARQVRKREIDLRWQNDPGALLRDRERRDELDRLKERRKARQAFEATEAPAK